MLTILRERELSAAAPSGQAAGDGKGK
jgi:hypothetical protein